jgi:nitrogen regulatory protein P-II 1
MIKLELLANEDKVEEIKNLLREIGMKKISLSEVREYDEEHAHLEGYRGAKYVVDFIKKIKIEVLLSSEEVIDRTLHMLSVADIGAEVLVYNISKSYHISKRESKDNTFVFGDQFRV